MPFTITMASTLFAQVGSSPLAFSSFGALTASLCLIFVPHVLKAFAVVRKNRASNKAAKAKDDKKTVPLYDLRNPRSAVKSAIDDTPEGRAIARFQSCHDNHLEAFPMIVAGVLAAEVTGVPNSVINGAATVFVAARVAYTVAYCAGTKMWIANIRSALWFVGLLCVLFLLGAAREARAVKA